MNRLLCYLRDFIHERRIASLTHECATHCQARRHREAHDTWVALAEAIGQRSPAQVVRMERRLQA